MTILGIETSCDETAAAVVRDGREVLSSVVYSQVPLHQPYGGVVPEIASRSHVEKLPGVVREAMREAGGGMQEGGESFQHPTSNIQHPTSNVENDSRNARTKPEGSPALDVGRWTLDVGRSDGRLSALPWSELDAIAVTYGPGLASSLIVGLSAAKGLALRLNKPLIGINHIEAHMHAVFLSSDAPAPEEACPLLALVVSGGHSLLVDVPRPGVYHVIGQTLDDAAGEAFDKAAQLLGLGYPGGPAIDRAARQATMRSDLRFPQGRVRAGHHLVAGGLRAELCVSFSGLKTALMYHLRKHPVTGPEEVNAIAASYQEAIVSALADRCERALRGGNYRCLVVGGGVSLNARLRERLREVADSRQVQLLLAEPKYCGDNAAMIAGLAGAGGGVRGPAALALDVAPSLAIDGRAAVPH